MICLPLFLVSVTDPKFSTSDWIEGGNTTIRINSTINCKLNSNFIILWKHVNLDNSIRNLTERSEILELTSLSRNDSGKYYYQILRADGRTAIYTSHNTTTIYVSCK